MSGHNANLFIERFESDGQKCGRHIHNAQYAADVLIIENIKICTNIAASLPTANGFGDIW